MEGVASSGSIFVQVSQNEKKVTLVNFYYDLFNKSTLVGYAATAIDLRIGCFIDNMNNIPVLYGGNNDLIYTSQAREFGITIHAFCNFNVGKQYIHYGDCIIPIKLDNSLYICAYLETYPMEV